MKLTEPLRILALGALLTSSPLACGDSENETRPDATVIVDASQPDAQVPRAFCVAPEFTNPECQTQSDCVERSDEVLEEVPGCEGDLCRGYAASVCTFGECELREDLENEQNLYTTGINVVVNTGGLQNDLSRLLGLAIPAETVGGETVTCDGVRDGTLDLLSSCLNVVDVRLENPPQAGTGDSIVVGFNRVPADREMLFIVYGYPSSDATGLPIGLYCTRQRVPAPQPEAFRVDAEPNFPEMLDLR